MNEKTEQYVKLLKKHIDRIAVGVMWLFFAALVAIWYLEQSAISEEPPQPPVAEIVDPIPKNPAWPVLQTMSKDQPMTSYPAIAQIRRYNMFDYKNVADQQTIERNISAKMTQAQQADKEGKLDDAVRITKEVLELKPTHKPARELLETVEKKRTKPAAAPGAPPPAAP